MSRVARASWRSRPLCSITTREPSRVNPLIGDVFGNLISNAAKYGAEGTKIVVVFEPAGENWRISVVDLGPGVPDRDKQAIFTRFTRRAREGVKGTGLGLSIVQKIVVAHGGRVWVEDNPGGGSVFFVELPRRHSVADHGQVAHGSHEAG